MHQGRSETSPHSLLVTSGILLDTKPRGALSHRQPTSSESSRSPISAARRANLPWEVIRSMYTLRSGLGETGTPRLSYQWGFLYSTLQNCTLWIVVCQRYGNYFIFYFSLHNPHSSRTTNNFWINSAHSYLAAYCRCTVQAAPVDPQINSPGRGMVGVCDVMTEP